jgi:uncharacterized repeat protein (TIGR03803 family)
VFTIGGTLTGLASGKTVTLALNGAGSLTLSSNGPFTFSTPITSLTQFAITVAAQPSDELCTVAGGSGTITYANIANAVVTCANENFSVGGTITGLSSDGLVLTNGADTLSVPSGSRSFTMPKQVAVGATYSLLVKSQPVGESCAIQHASGTMPAANVKGVLITCTDQPYSLGGTILGLGSASGLVVANGSDTLSVAAGSTSFTLPTKVPFGSSYSVAISAAPPGLNCSVSNGFGTMPAENLTNIVITCADLSYSLGGTISGLTTDSLVLTDGTDQISISANATQFTMPTPVAFGSHYDVAVLTQPQNATCSVAGGVGVMGPANVTNVQVACAPLTVTIGGTISGLGTSGLILANNGSDLLTVMSGAQTFTMPTSVANHAGYQVTVVSHPAAVDCSVTNGSGTTDDMAVTNIQINCVPGSVSVLYSFGAYPGDASAPQLGNNLIQAANGLLYGVTYGGGPQGTGTIFKLNTDGTNETVVSPVVGLQVANPQGSLIQAANGNFYGETASDVFVVTPDGNLNSVGLVPHLGPPPYAPRTETAGLTQALDGTLYGASGGSSATPFGSLFKVTAAGVLPVYLFKAGTSDGAQPTAAPSQLSNGNLIGVTGQGGTFGAGVVFTIEPDGSGETVLHNFGSSFDGRTPVGGLLLASDGKLYGVTEYGGVGCNCGIIYSLDPSDGYQERIIHTFQGVDGTNPTYGSLIQANDGNIYGMTQSGGIGDAGTIFRLTLDGRYSVVYTFFGNPNGALPVGSLVQGRDGNVYGMTNQGGSGGQGIVFKLN